MKNLIYLWVKNELRRLSKRGLHHTVFLKELLWSFLECGYSLYPCKYRDCFVFFWVKSKGHCFLLYWLFTSLLMLTAQIPWTRARIGRQSCFPTACQHPRGSPSLSWDCSLDCAEQRSYGCCPRKAYSCSEARSFAACIGYSSGFLGHLFSQG